MKNNFENILKAISTLSDNNKAFIIKNLKEITGHISIISHKLNIKYGKDTGLPTAESLNSDITKSFELLKVFGFNENTFAGINPDFLCWFIDHTTSIAKFNPKLLNYYILNSFQQAYFITVAGGWENPDYNLVKKTMLTFKDVIKSYEDESKLSFEQLINSLDE